MCHNPRTAYSDGVLRSYPLIMRMSSFSLFGLTTAALVTTVLVAPQAIAATFQAESGVTSVFLDTTTLESVGLSLTGTSNDVVAPASDDFLVGFTITPNTNFVFTHADGFAPVSGSIEHIGSVTFNNQTTVGNFSIGFDPSRAQGSASGFFVKDTVTFNAVLFDVAIPETVTVDGDRLLVQADLLVSPEFAGVLNNASLTGAVVGKAQINANTSTVTASTPEPATMLGLLGVGSAVAIGRRLISK